MTDLNHCLFLFTNSQTRGSLKVRAPFFYYFRDYARIYEMENNSNNNQQNLSRRKFLTYATQGAVGISIISQLGLAACNFQKRTQPIFPAVEFDPNNTFSPQEWKILHKIQTHILPSEENAPGALEVNAIAYFDAALRSSEDEKLKIENLKSAIKEVENLALNQFKKNILILDSSETEKLLREFEKSDSGYDFLSEVITYTLEAFLGDPIYGGNPNGIAWKYLDHRAGFPQPKTPLMGKRI